MKIGERVYLNDHLITKVDDNVFTFDEIFITTEYDEKKFNYIFNVIRGTGKYRDYDLFPSEYLSKIEIFLPAAEQVFEPSPLLMLETNDVFSWYKQNKGFAKVKIDKETRMPIRWWLKHDPHHFGCEGVDNFGLFDCVTNPSSKAGLPIFWRFKNENAEIYY